MIGFKNVKLSNFGESRDSNAKNNDFKSVDSRGVDPKNLVSEDNSGSAIEELDNIRIVRKSKDTNLEEVGVSSRGDTSEHVTLAILPQKPRKARRL